MSNVHRLRIPGRARQPFGAINLAPGGQAVSPVQGAEKGAVAGSSWGPIGTVVGAAIGAAVGLLSSKPNTAAHLPWANQLASALAGVTASPGLGRQLPLNNDTPSSYGITQMVEAIMASGLWMSWDPSLISNYDVCAHWAMTFTTAVQVVVKAICANPIGAKVSVQIDNEPGGQNIESPTFTFVNPGPYVGCDVISGTVIMGPTGLMYHMIIQTGETAAHAALNATNSAAQKVFALMVDYFLGAYGVPVNATAPKAAVAAPAAPKPTAAAVTVATTPAPVVTGTSAAGTPVVAPDDTDALIAQLIAQGQSQTQAITAAMQSLESNGIDSSDPTVQSALQSSAAAAAAPAESLLGIPLTTWLVIAAVGAAGYYFYSRKS